MNCGLDCLDLYVLATAFASFGFFVVAHVLVLRSLRSASALKVLVLTFFVGLLVDAVASLWPVAVRGSLLADHAPASLVVAALASWLIYGILGFNYVIGFFNLGETARRIRLVRELQRAARPLTLAEIYEVYNADMILEARLSRLVRSGQLRYDGEAYSGGSRLVLTQARLVWLMRAVLGIPKDRF